MIVHQDDAGRRSNAVSDAAGWLGLAATPTFAVMALLSATSATDSLDMLCAAHASPLAGMTAMYLLMSAFHAAPWVKLVSRGRSYRSPPEALCGSR